MNEAARVPAADPATGVPTISPAAMAEVAITSSPIADSQIATLRSRPRPPRARHASRPLFFSMRST